MNIIPETFVYFDEYNLNLILRNLVRNAIKFTPENGKIVIDCIQKTNAVALIIEDNGTGMDQQVINSIVNKTLVNSMKGTNGEKGLGIGWQICKILLDQNGADFSIESELKKGTRIEIVFPNDLKVPV